MRLKVGGSGRGRWGSRGRVMVKVGLALKRLRVFSSIAGGLR